MWNLLLTTAIPPRPLIPIGTVGRRSSINSCQSSSFFPKHQRRWLSLAPDVDTAFRQLQEMLSSGKV